MSGPGHLPSPARTQTSTLTPAVALVPIDEYEALEETAEILSDPDALSALEAGLADLERGETVTLGELVPTCLS